jgi:hypothetical protein
MFLWELKNKFNSILVCQLLIGIVSILFLLLVLPLFGLNYHSQLRVISITGTIAFALSIYFYYRETKTLFSPYIIFYTVFFLFHFGQCLMYGLFIQYKYYVFDRFSSDIVINGALYSVFCIIVFHLGNLVVLKSKKSINSSFLTRINNEQAIRAMGYLLFFLSIFPAFYNSIYEMIVSIKYGYAGTYKYAKEPFFLFTFLQNLFIPSCILLIVTFKQRDVKALIIKLIVCVYAGILLIVGGRTEGIAIFLTLLFLNNVLSKKISRKALVNIGLVLCLIIILIPTLHNFRIAEQKSVGLFFEEAKKSVISNPVVETVGEMGYSISPLFMTMGVIPEKVDYQYGKSYLASITSIIPAHLNPIHSLQKFSQSAALDDWLMKQYKMDFGPGYSLIAESYYNFGFFGISMMFIWGIILGWLLNHFNLDQLRSNRLSLYFNMVCFYALLTLPRRPSFYFVDQIIYLVVFVWIGILLFQKLFIKMRTKA